MAHIEIVRRHRLGREAARRTAEGIAADLQRRYGVRWGWRGDTLHVESAHVNGALTAGEDVVRVTATLGLTARPFRRALEAEIQGQLDRAVGATGA